MFVSLRVTHRQQPATSLIPLADPGERKVRARIKAVSEAAADQIEADVSQFLSSVAAAQEGDMYPYSYPWYPYNNASIPDSEIKSIIDYLLRDLVENSIVVEALLTNFSRAAYWDPNVDDPLIANIEIILNFNNTTPVWEVRSSSLFEIRMYRGCGACVVRLSALLYLCPCSKADDLRLQLCCFLFTHTDGCSSTHIFVLLLVSQILHTHRWMQ